MCNIFSRHHHSVKCHCLSYIFIPIFICFTLVAPQKCYLRRKSPLYFSPQSLSICDMCKYNFLRRKYIRLMHSTETIAFSWDVWRKKESRRKNVFIFPLSSQKRPEIYDMEHRKTAKVFFLIKKSLFFSWMIVAFSPFYTRLGTVANLNISKVNRMMELDKQFSDWFLLFSKD